MLRLLAATVLLLTLTTCQDCPACPENTTSTSDTTTITATDRTFVPGQRIGLLDKPMTEAAVRQAYGAPAVRAATLYGAEGITYDGTLLFPDTDDELELSLTDGAVSAVIKEPGGHWACAEHGVRIGTSLEELVRLNGGPFTFSGFGWDYGGNVTDWQGGALSGHAVRLGYDMEIIGQDSPFYDKTLGDITVRSDDPVLVDQGVRVDRIYVLVE